MSASNLFLSAAPDNHIVVHTINAIADNTGITFDDNEEGGSAQSGLAATVASAGPVVSTVANLEPVLGQIEIVESDLICSISKGARRLLPGTGATFTVGYGVVGDLLGAAEGYVQGPTLATLAEVAAARGEVLDTSDIESKVTVWLP